MPEAAAILGHDPVLSESGRRADNFCSSCPSFLPTGCRHFCPQTGNPKIDTVAKGSGLNFTSAGYAPTPRKEMGKIRVLVASDYQMVRSGLRQLLKMDKAFDVLLADAEIGKGLPRLCQTLSPDVLLMAAATNSPSNLRVMVTVLAVVPRVRILVVGASESSTFVRAVHATGALGYILKAATESELFQAVKQVHGGRRFIDPRLERSLSDHLLSPVAVPRGEHLSRREVEVLRAIALGFTTREISKELDLSQKTVQTCRERIYKKLALHTRADLVHYALAHGLAGWDRPRANRRGK